MAIFPTMGPSSGADPNYDWVKAFQDRLMQTAVNNASDPTNPQATPVNDPWSAALATLRANPTALASLGKPGGGTITSSSGPASTKQGLTAAGVSLGRPQQTVAAASGAAKSAAREAPNTPIRGGGSAPQAPSDQLDKYIQQFSGSNIFRTPLPTGNNWYTGYTPASLGILSAAGNEKQADYAWGANKGYGQFAQGALTDYANPNIMGLIQGITDPAQMLKFYDAYNTQALTPGAQTLDPRAVMQRILSASNVANTSVGGAASGSDPLGTALYSSTHPEDQVAKVIQYTKAALQGIMSQEGLDAYLNYLTQQGQSFIDWKMRNPTLPGNFGRWVLDRSGGNVGF